MTSRTLQATDDAVYRILSRPNPSVSALMKMTYNRAATIPYYSIEAKPQRVPHKTKPNTEAKGMQTEVSMSDCKEQQSISGSDQ